MRVFALEGALKWITAPRPPVERPRLEKCPFLSGVAGRDHLVIATGHQWPAEPEVRPGYFLSPWPASALAKIPACSIGIRGASLTAIDAAVALAVEHGEFAEDGGKGLLYRPGPAAGDFRMTMMSRKGLLPEADFVHPVP